MREPIQRVGSCSGHTDADYYAEVSTDLDSFVATVADADWPQVVRAATIGGLRRALATALVRRRLSGDVAREGP